MGAIHYYSGKTDSAEIYFNKAEAIYTDIERISPEKKDIPKLHAQLLNNQAAIDFYHDKLQSAYDRLKKALSILPPDEAENDKVVYLKSLGTIC
jgi:tetratricopeptide (TPR) repeat protein